MEPSVPRSKRLLTDERSNIFVYMTGHGGNEFLKFQDNEEISAFDLADAFEQMYQKKRYVSFFFTVFMNFISVFFNDFSAFSYNEIFFMIDTCQANTLHSKLYSPNIFAVGSAGIGENSYSVSPTFPNDTFRFFFLKKIHSYTQHENDQDIGVAVIDAFTHYVLQFMEKINKTSQVSMQELVRSLFHITLDASN